MGEDRKIVRDADATDLEKLSGLGVTTCWHHDASWVHVPELIVWLEACVTANRRNKAAATCFRYLRDVMHGIDKNLKANPPDEQPLDDAIDVCRAVVSECRDTFHDPADMSPEWQRILKAASAVLEQAAGSTLPGSGWSNGSAATRPDTCGLHRV